MSIGASLVCLAMLLPGALVAPALAQSPAPTDAGIDLAPVQEPSALCGVITPDEVSAALQADLAVSDSTDYDCSWSSQTSDTSLLITRDAGDFELDAQEVFPDGVTVEVGGRPGWYTPEGIVLFVDLGDGVLFTLEYFGTAPDDLDLQAALTGLGGLAVPRLAQVPMPTEEPEATPQGDPILEALIPTTVGEAETVVDVYTARDLLVNADPDDPDAASDIAALEALVGAHGATLDDVSFADAYFATETAYGDLFAIRVAGANVAEFQDELADLVLQLEDPHRAPATIAGHEVTVVTEGPPASGSPDPSADPEDEPLPPSYLYPTGEVLFIVSADEPQLSELFALLP